MQTPREQRALVTQLNDRSRKASRTRHKVIVPLKFDDDGNSITKETFNPVKHLKALNLDDLHFLKTWRENGWDIEKTCKETLTDEEKAKRLIRKLQVFKDEEGRVRALADIPSPAWISAKHTENVFEGKLDDSQRDSLKELAKITGAYKPTQSVSVQISLEKPAWTPEQEAKIRDLYDTFAEPNTNAA